MSRWTHGLTVSEVPFYERVAKQEIVEWDCVLVGPKRTWRQHLRQTGITLAELCEGHIDAVLWRTHARLPAARLPILRPLVSPLALSTQATGWAIRLGW